MRELFKYELYKLFHQKIIIILCVCSVVANIFTFYIMEKNTVRYKWCTGSNRIRYEQFQKEYEKKDISIDEYIEKMQYVQDFTGLYMRDYWTSQGRYTEEEFKEEIKKMEKKYEDNIDNTLEKLKQLEDKIDFTTARAYSVYSFDWLNQGKYVLEYETFRNQMKERADTLQDINIFSKKGSFVNQNLIKTYQDFEKLGEIKIATGNQYGMKAYFNDRFSSVFLIFIIVVLCSGIWSRENEMGLLLLLKSKKKGKQHLFFSKVSVLFLSIMIMNAVYLGSIFLLSAYFYGMGDLSVSIQSVEKFRNCCINLSVEQFIFLSAATQAVAACIIGLLVFIGFMLFNEAMHVYVILGIMTIVSLGCYRYIDANSSFSVFKFINITDGMRPVELYGTYRNLNIAENAVSLLPVFGGFILVLFLISIICGNWIWCTGKKINLSKYIILPRRKKRVKGSVHIFSAQLYKNMIQEKKVIFCAILLFYGIYTAFFASHWSMASTETEGFYKQYMQELEGTMTEEKENIISEKKQEFEQLLQRMEALLGNDDMDMEKYAELAFLNTKTGLPYDAFQEVLSQYDYLKTRREEGKETVFLESYSWNKLFDYNQDIKKIEKIMAAAIIVILLCGSVFSDAKQTSNLIASMKNGRRKLWRKKYELGIIFAIFSWLCIILPDIIWFARQKPLRLFFSELGNLQMCSHVKENQSILLTLGMLYLVYLFVCIILAFTTMFLTDIWESSFNAMSFNILVVIIVGAIQLWRKQEFFCLIIRNSAYPVRKYCYILAIMAVIVGLFVVLWEKEILFPKRKWKVGR